MRNYERVQQYARERAIKDANKRIDEIVLDLLTDIEMEQDVINDQLVKLYTMMGQSPTFAKRWSEFQLQGGNHREGLFRLPAQQVSTAQDTQEKASEVGECKLSYKIASTPSIEPDRRCMT